MRPDKSFSTATCGQYATKWLKAHLPCAREERSDKTPPWKPTRQARTKTCLNTYALAGADC